MQYELPEENLNHLRFQKNLSSRGKDIVTFVHRRPINDNRNPLPDADAFNTRPFAEWAFDVVLAVGINDFLEARLVLRPPELLAGIDRRCATFLPARSSVLSEDRFASH